MPFSLITIEDELIIAEDLKQKLESLGFIVLGNARDHTSALTLVRQKRPDIIISDIMLQDSKDGIETVQDILKFHQCPIIYLTANSEIAMVKRAISTFPAAYLIKPFKLSEFAINIELAIENFKKSTEIKPWVSNGHASISEAIFVPHQFLYYKVKKEDIMYVEADGSYVKLFTTNKKFHLTTNLKTFEAQFHAEGFYRVSRKHLINVQYVDRINGNMLWLKDTSGIEYNILISKPQRAEILSQFEIIRTKG